MSTLQALKNGKNSHGLSIIPLSGTNLYKWSDGSSIYRRPGTTIVSPDFIGQLGYSCEMKRHEPDDEPDEAIAELRNSLAEAQRKKESVR